MDQAPSLIENALNASEPERPERKPGWAMVPLLTLSVLLLTATVVGILTGLIKPFTGLASDSTSPTPSSSLVDSPTPSPTVSLSPSPSPSPTGSALPTVTPAGPPAFPVGGALLVSEMLVTPGALFEDKDELEELQSSCIHTNSGYLVTSSHLTSNYRCGNNMIPDMTDIAASVEVNLRNAESCAAIWFRYDIQGYLLSICPNGYAMYSHYGQAQESVKTFKETVKVKETFTVGIVMRGDVMQFFHNGRFLFSVKDGTYLRGKVSLGIGRPIVEKDPRPREVLYRNLKITALPSSQP